MIGALRFAKKVVHAADALRVLGLVFGQRPQEHFVAPQRIRPIAFHEVVWGLDVVLGFGHLLHFVAAGVGPILVEDEFSIGKLRPSRLETLEVERVALDQIDVHVQALRAMGFPLVGRHKSVGALDAVDKARAP